MSGFTIWHFVILEIIIFILYSPIKKIINKAKTDDKNLPTETKKDYRIWLLIVLVLGFGGYFVMDNIANKEQQAIQKAKEIEKQNMEKVLTALCGKGTSLRSLACRDAWIKDAKERKRQK